MPKTLEGGVRFALLWTSFKPWTEPAPFLLFFYRDRPLKVETAKITNLSITEVDRLDPVYVYLEDIGPRKGRITISCYNDSWTSYWGGMDNRTIAEFFLSCHEDYLANNLSDIPPHVFDPDAFQKEAKAIIVRRRRQGKLDQFDARDMFDRIGYIKDPFAEHQLMEEIYGKDWVDDLHNLPRKVNPRYEYLCRIIQTVKDALKLSGLGPDAPKHKHAA